MDNKTRDELIATAIRENRWMIHVSAPDGVSYGGFKWNPVGKWTEAPDFDPTPDCGGGLHGQGSHGTGHLATENVEEVAFCIVEEPVSLGNKMKCRRAMRLAVNDLSVAEGLHVGGSLDLSGTGITALPEGLHVGGSLYLSGTAITALPEGLRVAGSLDLSGTAITALPEGLHVGRWLDLSGTGITALPEGLHVGGCLYR